MSLKVGITGGMGAGKSMVAEIFRTFGIPVYDADLMAKKLMDSHPVLKESIRATFGEEAYIHGHLNKSFLAQTIFSNEENLARMNELVHPVVINDYENWHKAHPLQLYTIKEAALLFESGSYKDLDKIILVLAPPTIRLHRILLRDQHRTRADIENIMAHQMSDKDKKKLADFIIINDEHKMVIPQVLDIHDKLLNEIKQD